MRKLAVRMMGFGLLLGGMGFGMAPAEARSLSSLLASMPTRESQPVSLEAPQPTTIAQATIAQSADEGLTRPVNTRQVTPPASRTVRADEGFQSAEGNDGILGSDVSIFELMRRAGAVSGGSVMDGGFYRSQNRRINREADALRERQRAILEQRAAEVNGTAPAEAIPAE